jgi:hypothetical protein
MQSSNPTNKVDRKISLKVQSQTKTKRIRELPMSFDALKKTVEALVKDDREPTAEVQLTEQKVATTTNTKDYSIRYVDPDNEMINVSDDDDLLTAYDIAESDF